MVVVCMVPPIPMVMMMGGNNAYAYWVSGGCRMLNLLSSLFVASMGNLKYLK